MSRRFQNRGVKNQIPKLAKFLIFGRLFSGKGFETGLKCSRKSEKESLDTPFPSPSPYYATEEESLRKPPIMDGAQQRFGAVGISDDFGEMDEGFFWKPEDLKTDLAFSCRCDSLCDKMCKKIFLACTFERKFFKFAALFFQSLKIEVF